MASVGIAQQASHGAVEEFPYRLPRAAFAQKTRPKTVAKLVTYKCLVKAMITPNKTVNMGIYE